ncbi:GDYXXLXY domain-containing protein [Roseofilum casamattae]|uniref:GDYXXLXY domain-containing protein n=1 Tax=Roseofilum casamattae BLCC-M143 TaxID=3022442 RepID=A0ABT7BR69_9CYAN|nr:GDYXXLXY domain-containing protein [Roseofilum casamattae]MDJ1181692.1 GDYXXLXY domain-containing protein [Roseofilum casamattae BLCC-M143]
MTPTDSEIIAERSDRQQKLWHFLVPFILQILLIASIPARAVYTLVTGTTVILQTQPVDPYDLLRGYSQTLSYDISQWETLQDLPGWKTLSDRPEQLNREFYLILEQPEEQIREGIPVPWRAIAISATLPQTLPLSQIALRGHFERGQLIYGLETYYIPEDRRDRINREIATAQQQEAQPFVVEIKVDRQGRAVPVRLCINQKCDRF